MKPVFVFMSSILLSLVLLVVGNHLASSGSVQADNPKMESPVPAPQTPEKNKEAVRTLFQDILNAGRLEQLNRVVAEDFAGSNGQKGPSAFAEPIRPLLQGFPNIQYAVEDLIAEGDRVVARFSWQGTHTGSFRGFPASQKQVSNKGIAIFQFKDGKIAQSWFETDRLGFLQQIGAVPQDLTPTPQSQKRR